MDERGDRRPWFWIAGAVVILAAAAVRFVNLGVSLFEDEVWVANLIRDGGLRPHTYNAPPLFYFLERMWVALRGFSDVILRELPMFFGVALAALPLAADKLAPGLTDRITRIAWAVLLAASSPLIYYSTRMKQYTLEAFIAALLLLLFFGAINVPTRARIAAFFIAATISVMLLVTPVFIVAAAGITLLTTKHRWSPKFLIGFAITAVAFVVAYFGWLAPGPETTRLHGDMTEWFTETGRWMSDPKAIVPSTLHWLGQGFNLARFWWAVVPLLVIVWLVRGGAWRVLLFAAVPAAIIFAASIVHVYPYGEVRLMSFTYPAIYLVLASALARRVWLLVLLAPFVWGGIVGDSYNRTYMSTPDLRALFAFVAKNTNVVYADRPTGLPLRHHHPRLDVRPLPQTPVAGWYVQRGGAPAGARVVMRVGDVTVARREDPRSAVPAESTPARNSAPPPAHPSPAASPAGPRATDARSASTRTP
jgi:uncharacterized membrane protein